MNAPAIMSAIDILLGIGIIAIALDALFLLVALVMRMPRVTDIIFRHGLLVGFLLSLCAALGTLYYSEVVGIPPCTLCWYQRALLYPQVLLFGYGAYKKDARIFPWAIALSTAGLLVALYHISLPLLTSSIFCDPETALCLIQKIKIFGFLTIPMMSSVIFTELLLLSVHGFRANKAKPAVPAPAVPTAL